MAVLEALTEEELDLFAILQDHSGLDQAEFLWFDPDTVDGCWRAWHYQWKWFRDESPLQIDQCARAVGKSQSIKLRGFAFPLLFPGAEMVITAPELIHLTPITSLIENQLLGTRLTRELLPKGRNNGITHRPFQIDFNNGARIIGRIPQRDGKGVKGLHPIWLELDEGQDYPEKGWMELIETLRRGHEGAVWRAHGVTKGVQDKFWEYTQDGSQWKVHRLTAMHRPPPFWNDQERQEKIEMYGAKDAPDYRRNVLGLHGDGTNPLFVLHRLMKVVDDDSSSDYNQDGYYHVRVNDEMIRAMGVDIVQALDFPQLHKDPLKYCDYWCGMDVGFTRDPTEILVFGEVRAPKNSGSKSTLELITRLHLERIGVPMQTRAVLWVVEFYKPRVFAMDSTGVGLPLFQAIQGMAEDNPVFKKVLEVIKGYNFSSKITVDVDALKAEQDEHEFLVEADKEVFITRNVLEYATDKLREYVDHERLHLPWDRDLIGEYQGATYTVRSALDPYGRRRFSGGKDHALDASRMAVLGHAQYSIEALLAQVPDNDPVFDAFVSL